MGKRRTRTAPPDPHHEPDALLNVRTALILLLTAVTGTGTAALMLLGHQPPTTTILASLAATAGSTRFFDWLIK
jgi:hypothetical protein